MRENIAEVSALLNNIVEEIVGAESEAFTNGQKHPRPNIDSPVIAGFFGLGGHLGRGESKSRVDPVESPSGAQSGRSKRLRKK